MPQHGRWVMIIQSRNMITAAAVPLYIDTCQYIKGSGIYRIQQILSIVCGKYGYHRDNTKLDKKRNTPIYPPTSMATFEPFILKSRIFGTKLVLDTKRGTPLFNSRFTPILLSMINVIKRSDKVMELVLYAMLYKQLQIFGYKNGTTHQSHSNLRKKNICIVVFHNSCYIQCTVIIASENLSQIKQLT